MSRRKRDSEVDWSGLERDYRAGVKSDRQLERDYGITRGRISRRAEKEGWQRDLKKKIEDAARSQLQEKLASSYAELDENATPEQREQQIVQCVAATQVELVDRHRGDIARLRGITMSVADLLQAKVTKGCEEIPDGEGSVVKLPLDLESVGKTLNNLTGSLTRIVAMERQAFGLDDKETQGGAPEEVQSVMDMVMKKTDGLPSEM